MKIEGNFNLLINGLIICGGQIIVCLQTFFYEELVVYNICSLFMLSPLVTGIS